MTKMNNKKTISDIKDNKLLKIEINRNKYKDALDAKKWKIHWLLCLNSNASNISRRISKKYFKVFMILFLLNGMTKINNNKKISVVDDIKNRN